jgi:hypothetical protein
MNAGMKIAIRWLAIADLALFFIVLVVGELVGKVVSNSAGFYTPSIPCPRPGACPISIHPLLFSGVVLGAVVTALSFAAHSAGTTRAAQSRGTTRAWRILLVILTVILVVSPLALYLPQVDTALIVMSVFAALASLIALAATLGDRMIESS